eukprot:g4811.t1
MWHKNTPYAKCISVDLEDLDPEAEQTAQSEEGTSQSVFATASFRPRVIKQGTEHVKQLQKILTRGANSTAQLPKQPDEIISMLRDRSVIKVGEFETNDPALLNVFQRYEMLTYGSDDAMDPNFLETWKSILRYEGRKNFNTDTGWHETMCLVVFCVNIRFAANVLGDGIIAPLLAKEETGDSSDDVWNFPCVRAVIEFKWAHWARKYLIAEFILYLGWLLCFVGFMIIYIQTNLDEDFEHSMNGFEKSLAIAAYFLDAGSVLFMCPFLVIEYNSIRYYKWQWLQMWNVLDALAYVLQILVTSFHFSHVGFHSDYYVTLLAIHCTLLFIKVQYFARVMGPRSAYVETLKTLIYNVRYFLLFIVLNMISAALSFAVLYKWENESKEQMDFNEILEDFNSVPRSVVTAYSVLLGNFESAYIFDTNNKFIKGIYFLLFQLFMAITVLNLLIAVMTESYTETMKRERITYNKSKAEIIDELELSLPRVFYPKFKPYIHFIVCEKRKRLRYELSALRSKEASTELVESDVKKQLEDLKHMITALQAEVSQLRKSNE